jgi:hypothetical protein
VPGESLGVVEICGGCMWPGLREGDQLLFQPQKASSTFEVGGIVVARSELGLVAHRVRAVLGRGERTKLVLGGDLGRDDPPRAPEQIVGTAKALYRPGLGFVDLPPRPDVSPLGAAVLSRASQVWSWAVRQLGVREQSSGRSV